MKASCVNCKHYFITFDQNAPRGCRAFQIKSKQTPSMVVKHANGGQDCMGFSPKPKKKDTTKNLNDSKYW